jgi:hypothetical protein
MMCRSGQIHLRLTPFDLTSVGCNADKSAQCVLQPTNEFVVTEPVAGPEQETFRMRISTMVAILALAVCAGCPEEIDVDVDQEFDSRIAQLVTAAGFIQTQPQVLPPVLVNEGDTIIIDNSVTIIDNPQQDIIFEEVPDINVIGFINETGVDIYVRYFVDMGFGDELQGIFVYDGETLLLEYPCLDFIALDTEEDIDPFTGELLDEFDLSDAFFFNPEDFFCGDALLFTFDPFTVSVELEFVDLLVE